AHGLAGLALRQGLFRVALVRAVLVLPHAEAHGEEAAELRGRLHVAVRIAEAFLRQPLAAAVAVQHFARRDVRPGLAAPGPGVHRERAAGGAGNAGHEAEARATLLLRELGEPRAVHAGLGVDRVLGLELEAVDAAVQRNHRALHAAVAHQQVAAEAE